MYNHTIFERFWGCLRNGNLDNIHTSAACSSTVSASLYKKNAVIENNCNCQQKLQNSQNKPMQSLYDLFVLRLNVPVNNFSVMSGRSHRFLGN